MARFLVSVDTHEAVVFSGPTEQATLAFLMLEYGPKKFYHRFRGKLAQNGITLTKEATAVGQRNAARLVYNSTVIRCLEVNIDYRSCAQEYMIRSLLLLASSSRKTPEGVHVPYADLINTDGTLKPRILKSGVQIRRTVCFSDDPVKRQSIFYSNLGLP